MRSLSLLLLSVLLTTNSTVRADVDAKQAPKLATLLPEKMAEKLPAKLADKLPAKLPAKLATQLPAKVAKRDVKTVTALPEKKASKTVRVVARKTKQKLSSTVKTQIATQLPAFKGKKRFAIIGSDMKSSDEAQTGVVVRSMSTADYAKYAARMEAEEKQNANAGQTTQVVRVQRSVIAAPSHPPERIEVTAAEEDNSPDVGEAPRPRIVEPPVAEPRIATAPVHDEIRDELAQPKVAQLLTPVAVVPPVLTKVVPQTVPVIVAAPTPQTVIAETAPVAEAAPVTIAPTIREPVVGSVERAVPMAPVPAPVPVAVAAPIEPPARPQTEAVYEAAADSIRDVKLDKFNDRIFISSAYLNAQYSQIEGQLENGATTIGFGYAHDYGIVEGRAAIEFTHGLDQSVTLGNARMLMLRGDAAYFFSKGFVSPFASIGVAIAKVNVQSYRMQNDGSTVLRDHDVTTGLGVTPGVGLRLRFTPRFDLEFKVEELAFFAGSQASALGGLSAGGALGWSF